MTQKPPKDIDKDAVRKWRLIVDNWELDESGLLILEEALRSDMRLRQARAILDREGITVTTGPGMIRKHPAAEIEKEARSGFLQAWRMLNLGIDPPGVIGRPGGS